MLPTRRPGAQPKSTTATGHATPATGDRTPLASSATRQHAGWASTEGHANQRSTHLALLAIRQFVMLVLIEDFAEISQIPLVYPAPGSPNLLRFHRQGIHGIRTTVLGPVTLDIGDFKVVAKLALEAHSKKMEVMAFVRDAVLGMRPNKLRAFLALRACLVRWERSQAGQIPHHKVSFVQRVL